MRTRPSAAPAATRLAAPHIVTELPGPRARALIARDQDTVSPSLTRAYPLVAESGSGYVVVDVDGNRFLDFAAGIAVVSTGHSHPAVVAAIKQMPWALLPGAGGTHIRCNGKAVAGSPALCVRAGLVTTLDDKGNPSTYKPVGDAPIED